MERTGGDRQRLVPHIAFALLAAGALGAAFARAEDPPAAVAPEARPSAPSEPACTAGEFDPDREGERLLGLLRASRFDDLAVEMRAYQGAYEREPACERRTWDAMRALEVSDPRLLPLLEAWIAGAPQSWEAHAALAAHLSASGWEARGNSYAAQTPRAQLDVMDAYFADAIPHLVKATELAPRLSWGHGELVALAMAAVGNPTLTQLYQRAEAVDPASYETRRAFMHSLEPRWAGSLEAMFAFADYSQHFVDRNPRIRRLRAYPYGERARLAMRARRYAEAVADYTRALQIYERPNWVKQRGKAHYSADAWGSAVADLDRYLELEPGKAWAHRTRGKAYYHLGAEAEAIADLDRAVQLAPTSKSAFSDRCWVHYKTGDYARARADCKRVLELEPGDDWAARTLVKLATEAGRP